MPDSNAFAQQTYTQLEVDAVIAIVGRQALRAQSIVEALKLIVTDRSITAAGRALAKEALDDARAIVAGADVVRRGS